MNNKGQFSIIAALFVAVVLISTVMITYSTIRNSPIQDQPQVLSAIDETNFAIKQILGFTVGYYCSVLQVTGNSSYARMLAMNYLHSGLINIANMHPEWGASFSVNEAETELHAYWFTNSSYSTGTIAITYDLTGLGIYGITYKTSCELTVQVKSIISSNQTKLVVMRDEGEPLINLGKRNFKFYRYRYTNLTWELVTPDTEPIVLANGTYIIDIPQEVDPYSYVVQVEDQRGLIVVASSFSRYIYTLAWNSTLAGAQNYVDNNTSDVDSSSDKGTHSNFPAQQYGPDSIFDVLTEENTGGGGATQWEYAESLSESSSSSTSFTEKVRLTFTPSSVGDWLVIITFQARHTNTGDSFEVRGQLDDDSAKIICQPNQEPEINNPTREYRTFGHFRVFQYLSASEHHVDVDYRTQDSGTTMYIKNVRIVAIQIEDIDNVKNAYAEYENQVSNPGSGFTDYAEATITPTDDDKKYLVIGCAEVQPSSSTSYYSEARISVDDTSYYPEEAPTGVYFRSTTKDLADWFPLMTSTVVTLSSGSHTVAYQLKGASYSDFRRIRIFVMRLDDVYEYEYVSNPTENSQTGTTWKDSSVLQFTSSATDYLILASMCGRLGTNGYSFQNRFTIGGGSQIDHNEEQSDASYRSFQYVGIKTLSAESQTFKTQFRAYDAARTAYVKESFIIAIKKPAVSVTHELDLEVQWTNVNYNRTNEELCIYAYEGNNTYSMDATGGYMVIGDGMPDWGSTAGTISFWIQWDTVDNRPWGQHGDMETRFSGSNLVLGWGSAGSITSSTSFTAGKWYFIAIVWDENTDDLYLYVGDEDNAPTEDTHIVGWTDTVSDEGVTENNFMASKGGVNPTDGQGDDLRYWDIDRTLAEIQSDYDTELTGSETNLRSYFKLNNNFDDIGPDNNDGSGSGSYLFQSDVPFDAPPTENLRVDVWTGSVWQNLFTNLTSGWNNVSVSSYLDSSTFTIRFKGANETGDTTQDSWKIDATLLHLWPVEDLYLLLQDATIVVELLQNGTMRWLGQNLQLTTQVKPIPPIPVKAIHINQTINGINREVPFQIEDWASDYRIPLGLTDNASVFKSRTMLVFLANPNVSKVTIWWNGSDTAIQTPYAYTNRHFTVDTVQRTLTNGLLNLEIDFSTHAGVDSFKVISTVGTSTSTAEFMRINNKVAHYGHSEPTYAITNGTVRAVIHHEVEWSGGIPNCPNVYAHIVLTLPANVTYYTYQLRFMFVESQLDRPITDLCPIEITASTGQPQTENGTAGGYPIISNTTGLFYNLSASTWAHHWSQFISGTKGAGIMFTDNANQMLYIFDTTENKTGALEVSNSTDKTIEMLPVAMAQVSFTSALDVTWHGAVVTFDGTTPIYKGENGTGLWIIVEYPPIITVTTEN